MGNPKHGYLGVNTTDTYVKILRELTEIVGKVKAARIHERCRRWLILEIKAGRLAQPAEGFNLMINELNYERTVQKTLRRIRISAQNAKRPVYQPWNGQMGIADAALLKQLDGEIDGLEAAERQKSEEDDLNDAGMTQDENGQVTPLPDLNLGQNGSWLITQTVKLLGCGDDVWETGTVPPREG